MQAAPTEVLTRRPLTSARTNVFENLVDGEIFKVNIITIHDLAVLFRASDRNRKINLSLELEQEQIDTAWLFFNHVLAQVFSMPRSHHAAQAHPFRFEFVEATTPAGEQVDPVNAYCRLMTTQLDDEHDRHELESDQPIQDNDLGIQAKLCMTELRWLTFRVKLLG